MSEDTDDKYKLDSPRSAFLTPQDRAWIAGEETGNRDNRIRNLRIAVSQMFKDIQFLFEADLTSAGDPPIDRLGELFARIESDTELNHQECAEHLITLAFIIANEPIDYATIAEQVVQHPRSTADSPFDEDRPRKGGPIDFNQPVEEMLGFRNAVTAGILQGKKRVERDEDVPIPDTVLIDSNIRLYKEPTKDRLDPEGFDGGFQTEDWKDAMASHLDAHLPDESESDVKRIELEEGKKYMAKEIHYSIESRLEHQRLLADEEIIRHDAIQNRYRFSDQDSESKATVGSELNWLSTDEAIISQIKHILKHSGAREVEKDQLVSETDRLGLDKSTVEETLDVLESDNFIEVEADLIRVDHPAD